jgi:hypothetical protein
MNTIRATSPGSFPYLNDGVHTVALGNMTQYEILIHRHRHSLWIGICGKGCYPFSHKAHPNYVQEKLKILEADANNVADFINCQWDFQIEGKEIHGNYYPSLLADNN